MLRSIFRRATAITWSPTIFVVPLDAKVLAVYPHAHYLGKLLEGYATLPDGTRKTLIRIPEWDLSWQGVYHFKEPVVLPRGSVISMRFHYDNSADNVRNPNTPPKRVRGGSRANDEMGNLWLQVLPMEAGDQRAVLEEALARQRLVHEPDNYSANFNLGDLLLTPRRCRWIRRLLRRRRKGAAAQCARRNTIGRRPGVRLARAGSARTI